jgi:hypothetical protein
LSHPITNINRRKREEEWWIVLKFIKLPPNVRISMGVNASKTCVSDPFPNVVLSLAKMSNTSGN